MGGGGGGGGIIVSPQSSIILIDISSGSLNFPEFRFLNMQAMSLLVICMLSNPRSRFEYKAP